MSNRNLPEVMATQPHKRGDFDAANEDANISMRRISSKDVDVSEIGKVHFAWLKESSEITLGANVPSGQYSLSLQGKQSMEPSCG